MTNETSNSLFAAVLSGATAEQQKAVSTGIKLLSGSCTFAVAADFPDPISPSFLRPASANKFLQR